MISIIVPVYNVEQYLATCIESLIGQTYKDIEIILVNDCSEDRSLEICCEYAKKDSRIKVVNKEKNEGLGNARKSGVAVASGEWLCYVDSDDWIEINTFEELKEVLVPNVDIAVFGLTMCYEDEKGVLQWKDSVSPEDRRADSKEKIGDMLAYLDSHRTFPFMCNKIYNAGFVKRCNVEFNTIKSMEDFFYNIEIFEKASCIVSVDKAFYNYRKSCKETLATAYNSKFFELSEKRYLAEKRFLQQMNAQSDENCQRIYQIYVKHLIACFIRDAAKNAKMSYKQRLGNAKKYLSSEVTEQVLDLYQPSSLKFKVIAWVFKTKKHFISITVGKAAYVFQNNFKVLYRKLIK